MGEGQRSEGKRDIPESHEWTETGMLGLHQASFINKAAVRECVPFLTFPVHTLVTQLALIVWEGTRKSGSSRDLFLGWGTYDMTPTWL